MWNLIDPQMATWLLADWRRFLLSRNKLAMQWQKVRTQHPDTWILAEALQAHTTDDKRRIVEQWDVIGNFPDYYAAFQIYEELHRQEPRREMYVVHTVNEEVQIKERYRIDVRGI